MRWFVQEPGSLDSQLDPIGKKSMMEDLSKPSKTLSVILSDPASTLPRWWLILRENKTASPITSSPSFPPQGKLDGKQLAFGSCTLTIITILCFVKLPF
jgi:hypothetical protein